MKHDEDAEFIPRLYSSTEAAKHLRLAPVSVRDLCRAGKLPARKLRNKWFMTAEDIRAAMKA